MDGSVACGPSNSPFAALLSDAYRDAQTPTAACTAFQKAAAYLEALSSSAASSAIPYRELRDVIRSAVASQDPSLVIQASKFYLQLVAKVSMASEELTLSACIHHVSRILKNRETNGKEKCNQKKTICTQAGHVRITDFESFWLNLIELIQSHSLDVTNSNLSSLVIHGFGDLIQYARCTSLLDLALSGLQKILDSTRSLASITTIYKTSFPIARICLPAQNRKTLVRVLIQAASCEGHVEEAPEVDMDLTEHRDSDESPSSKDAPLRTPQHSQAKQCRRRRSSFQGGRYPIIKFLELCCLNVPDKADERSCMSYMVHQVLLGQTETHFEQFYRFLSKAAYHRKTAVRMVIVETVSLLIQESKMEGDHDVRVLLDILRDRCQDKMPTVRAKAIHSLTDAVKSLTQVRIRGIEEDLMSIASTVSERMRDSKTRVRKSAVEFSGFICEQCVLWHADSNGERESLPGISDTVPESGRRSPEQSVLKLAELLRQRTFDSSAMVRQAAIEQLTMIVSEIATSNLLAKLGRVFELWMKGVLAHVGDSDLRCQESCVNCIGAVVFPDSDKMDTEDDGSLPVAEGTALEKLPLLFLAHLGRGDHTIVSQAMQAIMTLSKKGKLRRTEIDFLSKKARNSTGAKGEAISVKTGAWMALEALAASGKAAQVEKALGRKVIMNELTSRSNLNACRIAAHLVDTMDSRSRGSVETALRKRLFSTKDAGPSDSTESFHTFLELLAALQEDIGDELLGQCEALLLEKGENLTDTETTKVLQVIGGICVSFKLRKEPSSVVLTFVQAMTSNVHKSSKLRALALATLGKICLCEGFRGPLNPSKEGMGIERRNGVWSDRIGEALTRKLVSVFVHELENATSSATRNNAVVVLCDICRRYTAVVEPFLPRLAELLCDPSEFVRVQVISSLVSLLQEDYIKIRSGPIFFKIATCLSDSSDTVRATAEYALLEVIAQKNHAALAVSFVELIFVLNNCQECALYNQFAGSRLSQGPDKNVYEQRLGIYEVFLRGMSADHRIRLPGRLRSEIISMITEGKLSIAKASVHHVLEDTLSLLSLDQLRPFTRTRATDQEGVNQPLDDVAEAISGKPSSEHGTALAKRASLVRKIQLLELRETTIPALLELRHHLEKSRSPLLRTLMKTLCTLLRPHRDDLETMIRDSVIRAEISHEISQLQAAGVRKRRSSQAEKENVPDRRGETPRAAQEGCITPRISAAKPPIDKLSVPRTKPSWKRSRRLVQEDESDDEEDGEEAEMAEGTMSRRPILNQISASPKLAALASRAVLSSPSTERGSARKAERQQSMFATAMARIEGETTS